MSELIESVAESEPVATCDGCGGEFAEDALDNDLCEDCRFTCEDCDMARRNDDAESVRTSDGERIVCNRCRVRNYDACAGCGEYHEDTYARHEGGRICPDCAQDMSSCEHCGEYLSEGSQHWDGDSVYCPDCAPEPEEEETVIAGYHSSRRQVRPLPSPFTRAHGGRFFGVELEVESRDGDRNDTAERIHDFVNAQSKDITADGHPDKLLYFEEDGSLSNGFEMVTAPMGLDDHARLWKVALSATLTRGLRSHDTETCGLHVHVSRTGLTDVQISKVVCFVNDPDNRQLIETVARRYDRGYCKVGQKKLSTAHHDTGDRYQAVNLCNARTIEFRIFRGTLRYASVMAAIEFANAVVQFATPANGVGFNLKVPAFLDFINAAMMRKHTAFLRLYLADKLTGVTFPAGFRPTQL